MDVFVTIIQTCLGLGGLAALIRGIRGPDLADRIIALDLILLLLAGGMAAQEAREGSQGFIPILVAVALVAFAGTVLVARFVEWRDVR